MRVVLDTNVLISALLGGSGPSARIVTLWREGRFELLTALEQLDEFARVTRYPKIRERLIPALAGRLFNEVRDLAKIMRELTIIPISLDPDDDYLLAIAAAGNADFIVTGDKRHVLEVRVYAGAKIVTVREFLGISGRA